jgi:hypothetical protein
MGRPAHHGDRSRVLPDVRTPGPAGPRRGTGPEKPGLPGPAATGLRDTAIGHDPDRLPAR